MAYGPSDVIDVVLSRGLALRVIPRRVARDWLQWASLGSLEGRQLEQTIALADSSQGSGS